MKKTLFSFVAGAGLMALHGAASAQVVLTVSSWLGPNHTLSQSQAK